ncbi:ice-binding family protein [Streptosporangium sp. NPDC023963]|uniref:ice-binding family protein n=1 Tax=Streptosporangium sp. NPDC023963 TaxID=3155608 RepID=UPI00341DBE36
MTRVGHSRIVPRNTARSWLAGVLTVAVALGCVAATPRVASAATAPDLLTAADYAVLAGTTVTADPGPTVVTGDLGVSPGSAVTGFPPGVVVGTVHAANADAAQAQVDLTAAYDDAAGQLATSLPTELGETTVTPGAYDSASGTFEITGELTLDGQGDPNAVFIFKTAATLVTASASTVNLTNGAQACNVFWQVGSSATLGTGSSFVGNILALTSITATTGVNVNGRLLARNGAVTMDTNLVTPTDCEGPPPREDRTTATTLSAVCSQSVAGRLILTATVTASGPTPPTGPAEFFSNGVRLGTAQIDANGRATLAVTDLGPGTYLVAAFFRNADLDASASAPQPVVVGPNGLCPPPPPPSAPAAVAVNQKDKDRQSIRNNQSSGNAIKIRDRKRKHHRHHSWARCCRHRR